MPAKQAIKGTVVPFPRSAKVKVRKAPAKKRKGTPSKKHNQIDPAFRAIARLVVLALKDEGVTIASITRAGNGDFSDQMLRNWIEKNGRGTCRLDKVQAVLRALDVDLMIDGEAY